MLAKTLPTVVVTMGDPAGIGPEVVVKALTHLENLRICVPVVAGHPDHLRRAADELGTSVEIEDISSLENVSTSRDRILCWPVDMPGPSEIPRAEVSAEAGRASYAMIETATRLVLDGGASAVATAPIHKESLKLAGVEEAGHTEILARLCNAQRISMLLVVEGLRISHVTTHVPLRNVPDLVTTERVVHVVRLTDRFLRQLGTAQRRIGVLALNPHAGEHGHFGTEDEEKIAPAVEISRREGLTVDGPLPADTAVHWAHAGRYDALVAMYHDQGHIPIKLLDFSGGVNVTLGLPIIRTSVDHGTAFDIVGQSVADPSSMNAALRLAAQLARTQVAGSSS